jgi:tetratricopeptide (TPR) repeat protein
MKDYKSAGEYAQKAIDINPSGGSPYLTMGNIYYTEEKIDKAEEYYNKVPSSYSCYYVALYNLGNIYYYYKKDNKKAIDYYEKCLTLNPDYYYGHYKLGLACYDTGEFEKSIEHASKALKQDPNDIYLINNIGIDYI